jgi:hypothetical protein
LKSTAKAGEEYSVTICGSKFKNKIKVFKVDLITPAGDPVNKPVDGGDGSGTVPDGANEFTFSPATVGVLTLKPKGLVTPSGIANQIAGQCLFGVATISGSSLAWDPANPGGKPTASGDNLLATVRFTGLPTLNTSFGGKKAAVYDADGCKLDEERYEVFFPKTALNHPGTGSGTTPNWFYYWAGTAVPGYDLTSGLYIYGGAWFHTPAKYNGDPADPHFTIYDNAADVDQYNSAGLTVDRKGIDTFAATLVHEKTHWGIDLLWQRGGDWNGKDDSDHDKIPDEVEIANAHLGLDRMEPSSFDPPFILGDDQDFWCEVQALGVVGDASKDWANPGKQSKNRF